MLDSGGIFDTCRASIGMASDTNTNSIAAVFGTPELLEMILLEAVKDDARTVLLSQRACKAFRDTVQISRKIHYNMFTVPKGARQLLDIDEELLQNPTHGITIQVPGKSIGVFAYGWRKRYTGYGLRYERARLEEDGSMPGGSWRHITLPRNAAPLYPPNSCNFVIQIPGWWPMVNNNGISPLKDGETLGEAVEKLMEWSKESVRSMRQKPQNFD